MKRFAEFLRVAKEQSVTPVVLKRGSKEDDLTTGSLSAILEGKEDEYSLFDYYSEANPYLIFVINRHRKRHSGILHADGSLVLNLKTFSSEHPKERVHKAHLFQV